jgi:hypothetical protein
LELLRRYTNRSDLLFDLCQAVDRIQGTHLLTTEEDQTQELASACPEPRQRLLSTRFTYEDIASMVAKYDSGTSAKVLAKEYQIGLTSIKRLIKERGMRRKGQGQVATCKMITTCCKSPNGGNMSESTRITLTQAVERYRQEPGSYSNAYDWYRKQAHQDGQVSLGGTYITAIKIGKQWTVAVAEVDAAIIAHRDRVAGQHQATHDYKSHILHGDDGATVSTNWGGYRISGAFHFAWNDYEVGRWRSDGSWYCNTCFRPTQTEHEHEECHTCSNWGGCRNDCTLSRILCINCGTSKDM